MLGRRYSPRISILSINVLLYLVIGCLLLVYHGDLRWAANELLAFREGSVSAPLETELSNRAWEQRGSWKGSRTWRRLYQSGFSPINLDRSRESVISAVGASYSPENERALVLGAGSGRSAGAVARVFGHVDVVDIGVTVPALLRALAADNFDLLGRSNVSYHEFDAILAPYALEPGYDLIILTVDPAYHAKAAKLYTLDYFRSIKTLLKPAGVFVFWSDFIYGAIANQILINTGGSAFEHQKVFEVYAEPGGAGYLDYVLILNGDRELVFEPDRFRLLELFASDSAASACLARPEGESLLAGRVHATERVHTLSSPAREILFGGYHPERIELVLEQDE